MKGFFEASVAAAAVCSSVASLVVAYRPVALYRRYVKAVERYSAAGHAPDDIVRYAQSIRPLRAVPAAEVRRLRRAAAAEEAAPGG